ncbi:MAG: lipoyl(octanoyl) transferase LipB [Saprospiraceae bacterium]|nr:lipoyl(octanoyl) transferase LipB [Saprospiraceae bacterium]
MDLSDSNTTRKVRFLDWGNIPYSQAWERQTEIQQGLISLKRANRDLTEQERKEAIHSLIFCSHPHVYTLGKSGSEDNLLLAESEREKHQVEYFKINRGGDITYHGPGQIVGYPIFDLDYFFTDVHKYVRMIEEAIIRLLASYGIEAGREEGFTGVWLSPKDGKSKRKICAIGVHLSRWVTLHGFALNVNTNLDFFDHIIPCGIQDPDKEVTSMSKELGRDLDMEEVKSKLKQIIADLFEFKYIED